MVKRLRRKLLCRSDRSDRSTWSVRSDWSVGETNRPDHKFVRHSIRRSSAPTNFPSFPCFPWTKNGLWASAHAKSFRV